MTHRLNLRLALESMADAPGRNVFALAGLTVGIAAVVAIIALTLMARREALRQFDVAGLNVIVVRNVSTAPSTGRTATVDLGSLRRLREAVSGIQSVAPVVERRLPVQVGARAPATLPVAGITEAFFSLHPLQAIAGRLLGPFDERENVAVLGRDAAAALGLAPEEAVGQNLTLDGRVCRVVGVLEGAPRVQLPGAALDKTVLIPTSTALRLSPEMQIGTIYVRTTAPRASPQVGRAVVAFLQHQTPGLALQFTGAEAVVAELTRQLRLYAVFFATIGGLALVVGGFAVMNGLLLAVAQRRVEIGLRRALGALRRDVQAQFLYEALLLGGAGGLAGTGLGILVAAMVARSAAWEFFLPSIAVLCGLLVAGAISAIAGFFPAFQAARLDPVHAMKP